MPVSRRILATIALALAFLMPGVGVVAADIVVPGCTISSGFMEPERPGHKGVDCSAPEGTPIYTNSPGTVVEAGPAAGFGSWIRILNDDETESIVGHMWPQGVHVQEGQRVNPGDKIGEVGNAGQSSGPHAHVEKRVEPEGGDSRNHGSQKVPVESADPSVPVVPTMPVPTPEPEPMPTPQPEQLPLLTVPNLEAIINSEVERLHTGLDEWLMANGLQPTR